MKKYMTPSRFTVFYVEHKERDGSLAVVPRKVMTLSDADVAAIRKMNPKVAAQLKPLPEPVKRPAQEPEAEELKEGLLDQLSAMSEEFGGHDDEG